MKKILILLVICYTMTSFYRPFHFLNFSGRNCSGFGFRCIELAQEGSSGEGYRGEIESNKANKLTCKIQKSSIQKADLDQLMKKGFILQNAIELNEDVSNQLKLKRKPWIIKPKEYFAKSENEQIVFEFDLVEADKNTQEGKIKPRLIPIKN